MTVLCISIFVLEICYHVGKYLGKSLCKEKKEKDDMQKFSVQSSGSAALFQSRKQWHHN